MTNLTFIQRPAAIVTFKRLNSVLLRKNLNNQISYDIKSTVIHLHLQATPRNDIARTCGVSEGTVSNIVEEWKRSLGIRDAEAVRELAVNLKIVGIDPAQCAKGFRILNTMRKLGVNENQFESFILEVYEYCQRYDLTPDNIASSLQALTKLLKDIPLAKIPEYIEEKKKEIKSKEEDIQTLNTKKKQ
jgi:DNA-binding Lrp family transcriptional regulator